MLYKYDIMVSVGEDDDVLKKALIRKLHIRNDSTVHLWPGDTAAGRSVLYTNGTCLLRLRDFKPTPFNISTLAHEVLHIVFFIFNDRGIGLSDNSDEAFCYYHGWLLEQILKKLAKFG